MADFGWAFVKGNLLTGSAPPSGSIQYNDGNNKFEGSTDLIFISGSTSELNLSGTLNVSGAINTNEFNINVTNKSVINLSATGSTKFGDTVDDTHVFTGSLDISGTSNPIRIQGLQSGTPPNSSSYVALDSNFNLVLTSAAGGGGNGGTIGPAPDGTYSDGLYTDFTDSTLIGVPIDRFNEILKILVPGPAPSVDQINYVNNSGIATKLSFQTQGQAPSGYIDVGSTGSFTSPPEIDDQYTVATSGEDFRLGVYNGTQEITGVINYQVSEQLKGAQVNYSTDSFGNAESGSLNLYLNGVLLHTLNLTASGAGNPNTGSASDLNSSGSGFFDISVTGSAVDQNGSEYNIFQHRTAKYVVDPSDQSKGWNYAKIEHQYGALTYTTNFTQWFNDTDASSQAMTVTNPRVTFTGGGSKYLSGVQYFRSSTLVYNSEVNNAYKFTYPTGSVLTFNVDTNDVSAIAAQSMPATDGTDLYNKILKITGSTATVDNTMLNDSTAISISLDHPLKTNLSSTGSVTTSGILIYNIDTANTNLAENFDLENFRITNGVYSTQVSASAAAATWNSEHHMTSSGAAGHTDGLLMYNGRLYSPKQGANGGNFSTLTNGPAANPNYSGSSGTRTFFRRVQNTSGATIRDLKISTSKATRFNDETLDTNNVKFSIKVPGATGFMDISQNFSYGNTGDDDGALINGATDNSNTLETDTGDARHCITFGTQPVNNNEYVVVRIQAEGELWTGFINTLTFQLGASDDASAPTAAPALDDIDLSDTAGEAAKLSFGTSNDVTGYTNVAGGIGSMAAVNSNGLYTDNEDTNRGVFKASEVMTGVLNQDVTGSGNNYPANSFLNAYTGSLLLIVNDATASTLSLADLNSTNNLSSNTGFSVGAVGFSTSTDNIPDYTKPYRTGTYSVGTTQQRSGWNYARVLHRIGASDTQTNYVQWVVDPSGSTDDTAVSTGTLARFSGDPADYYYSSGIAYFTTDSAPTASFTFTGSNFYSNVYYSGSDGVSFPTTTNCSINNTRITGSGITTFNSGVSQASMPPLNNTADCELTSIEVTGNVLYGAGTSISTGLSLFPTNAVSVKGLLKHVPNFKSNGETSTNNSAVFMFHSGAIGSTTANDKEYFNTETYRIVSGNYADQASVTNSGNTWNSQTKMNNGGSHDDGMVLVNGRLMSPLKIGSSGDTRSHLDGGSLEAPTGNPNYSTPAGQDIRTFYRYLRNPGPSSLNNFSLYVSGNATIVAKQGSVHFGTLGTNNRINIEMKIPGVTAWGDIAIPQGGVNPTVDGNGIFNGGNGNLDQDASNGSNVAITIGSLDWLVNNYIVLKVSAHKNWTGSLTEITASY
jgi:hypothetical protein